MRAKKRGSSPVSLTAGFAGPGGLFLSCCLLFPLSAGNSSLPQLKTLVHFKGNLFVQPEDPHPTAPSVNRAAEHAHPVPYPHGDTRRGSLNHRRSFPSNVCCKFCPVPSPYHNGTSPCGYSDVCLAWGDGGDGAAGLGGRAISPRGQLPWIHILECQTPLGRLKTTTCGVPRDVGKGAKEEAFAGDGQFKPGSPEPFDLGLGRLGYSSGAEAQSEFVAAGTDSDAPLTPPSDGPTTPGPEELQGDGSLRGGHVAPDAHSEGGPGAPQSGAPGAPLGSQEGEAPPGLTPPGLDGARDPREEEGLGERIFLEGGSAQEAASGVQAEEVHVQSGQGSGHAEAAVEEVPSAGAGAVVGMAVPSGVAGAPPSEVGAEEKRPAARAARAVPVGLEEFKRNMAKAAAAAAAAATETQGAGGVGEEGGPRGASGADAGGGSFVSRVYADGSRYNYASATHGAKVAATNPETKRPNAVLDEDRDKYLRVPCSTADKFLVVELSEFLTRVDTITVANFEFYASSVKEFEVWGSASYPTDRWVLLGTFCAKDVRQAQVFDFPPNEGHVRYVMLRWLSHHGSEFYCTLSLLRVFGLDELESLREEMLAINGGPHQRAAGAHQRGGVGRNPVFDRGAVGPQPSLHEGGQGPRMALGGGKAEGEEEDDDFLGRTVASLDGQQAEEEGAVRERAAPATAQAETHAPAAPTRPGAGHEPSAPGMPSGHHSAGPVLRDSLQVSTTGEGGGAGEQEREVIAGRLREDTQGTQARTGEAGEQGLSGTGRAGGAGAGGRAESGEAAVVRIPGVDKEAGQKEEDARAAGGRGTEGEGPAAAQDEKGRPSTPQDDIRGSPASLQAPTQPTGEGEVASRASSAGEAHKDSTAHLGGPEGTSSQGAPPSGGTAGEGAAEHAAGCKGGEVHAQGGWAAASATSEGKAGTPGSASSDRSGGEAGQEKGKLSPGEGDADPASSSGRGLDQRPLEAVLESKHTKDPSPATPPLTQAASHGAPEAGDAVRDPQHATARDSLPDAPQGTHGSKQTGTADVSASEGSAAAAGTEGSSGSDPSHDASAAYRPLGPTEDVGDALLPESPRQPAADGGAPQDSSGAPAEGALPQAPTDPSEHPDAARTAGTRRSGGASPGHQQEPLAETQRAEPEAHLAGPGRGEGRHLAGPGLGEGRHLAGPGLGEGRHLGQEQASPSPPAGEGVQGQGHGSSQASGQAAQDASADGEAQRGGSARAHAAPAAQARAGTPSGAPEAAPAATPDSASGPGAAGTGSNGTEAREASAPPRPGGSPGEGSNPQTPVGAGAGPSSAPAPEEVRVAKEGRGAHGTSGPSFPRAQMVFPAPESGPHARAAPPAPEARAAGADIPPPVGGGMEGEERAAGRGVVGHEDAGSDDGDVSSALARTPGSFHGSATPGAPPASGFPSVAGFGAGASITGGGTAAVSGLKALMLKLRALEQNQSVLEQYVENLGRAYGEGLTDLDSEIASLHSHVGRLSQATEALTATLRRAEDRRQLDVVALQQDVMSRSSHLEMHIQMLRGQVDAVERQMRQQMQFFAGLSLAAALSVLGLLLASWLWRRPTWDFVP